jgi:hypothetical protein
MLSAAAPTISSHRNLLAIWQVLFFGLMPILSRAATTQCYYESLAVSTNAAISAATPVGGCTVHSPEETACSFDYAPISATFEQACTDNGGRFHSQEWDFDCFIRYEGRQYESDYYYHNLPFCLGVSCTAADIQQYRTESINDLKYDFATQGIFCSGEMGDDSLLDGGLSTAVVVVLVVLLAVCWLCCCQQGSSRKTMYRSIDNTTTKNDGIENAAAHTGSELTNLHSSS